MLRFLSATRSTFIPHRSAIPPEPSRSTTPLVPEASRVEHPKRFAMPEYDGHYISSIIYTSWPKSGRSDGILQSLLGPPLEVATQNRGHAYPNWAHGPLMTTTAPVFLKQEKYSFEALIDMVDRSEFPFRHQAKPRNWCVGFEWDEDWIAEEQRRGVTLLQASEKWKREEEIIHGMWEPEYWEKPAGVHKLRQPINLKNDPGAEWAVAWEDLTPQWLEFLDYDIRRHNPKYFVGISNPKPDGYDDFSHSGDSRISGEILVSPEATSSKRTGVKSLAVGWQMKRDENGRKIFLGHNTSRMVWQGPRLVGHKLPLGWEEARTRNGEAYYVDHLKKTTSWDPPLQGQENITTTSAPPGLPSLNWRQGLLSHPTEAVLFQNNNFWANPCLYQGAYREISLPLDKYHTNSNFSRRKISLAKLWPISLLPRVWEFKRHGTWVEKAQLQKIEQQRYRELISDREYIFPSSTDPEDEDSDSTGTRYSSPEDPDPTAIRYEGPHPSLPSAASFTRSNADDDLFVIPNNLTSIIEVDDLRWDTMLLSDGARYARSKALNPALPSQLRLYNGHHYKRISRLFMRGMIPRTQYIPPPSAPVKVDLHYFDALEIIKEYDSHSGGFAEEIDPFGVGVCEVSEEDLIEAAAAAAAAAAAPMPKEVESTEVVVHPDWMRGLSEDEALCGLNQLVHQL